jgi:hypothetical protein
MLNFLELKIILIISKMIIVEKMLCLKNSNFIQFINFISINFSFSL